MEYVEWARKARFARQMAAKYRTRLTEARALPWVDVQPARMLAEDCDRMGKLMRAWEKLARRFEGLIRDLANELEYEETVYTSWLNRQARRWERDDWEVRHACP